ncbi:hypothetical protein FXO37_13304 [Capsicum annuum]|nr:hypothetical protein FXO37_13304 [Capsicum annuum]
MTLYWFAKTEDRLRNSVDRGEGVRHSSSPVVLAWLLLRINVVSGSPTILPPQPTIDEHDLFEDESLDAHPMDSEDHSMELEDPIFSEEAGEECELGAQTNHTFSDENNFQINEIFSSKKELKLFLDVVVVRNSFDYATLKSCSKFLKVKCICPSCAWMLRGRRRV